MRNATQALTARVRAVNRAGEVAGQVYALLVPIFRPLVGCKILKMDGSFLASVEAKLPPLPDGNMLRVTRQRSGYTLAWEVQTCELIGDGSCLYHEIVVYVGNLDRAVLRDIQNPVTHRTDYTVAEIERLRAEYEAAKKVAYDARSALYPFGEYDR